MFKLFIERIKYPSLILFTSITILLLTYIAPVDNTGSDAYFSLIVSQAVIEHGTTKLDAYYETHPELFKQFDYQVDIHNGHWYYNYPLGPSLFSVPIVWIANLRGHDMLIYRNNQMLQNALSSLLCVTAYFIIYKLSRLYLSPLPSYTISTISLMGSSLISTMGTALWNVDFTVFFILLGLYFLAEYDCGRRGQVRSVPLGLSLFAAYFTRPSASIFILIVFIYLFFKDKRALFKTAVIALIPFIAFIIQSKIAYANWLPFYYRTSLWFNTGNILRPLYGVTFGPSRGIFIYSPFFILVLIGGIKHFSITKKSLLFWLSAIWITVQIITVSTTRQWWGGYSFGPRLLTDAVPALIVMNILLWRLVQPKFNQRQKKITTTIYIALGLLAIFINSIQGLFSVSATMWNAFPSIDLFPEYNLDWRYPQFVSTPALLHKRRFDHYQKELALGTFTLQPYIIGETLETTDDLEKALFIGWWLPEKKWTEIKTPEIIFTPNVSVFSNKYALEITAKAYNSQLVTVLINGTEIGTETFTSETTNTYTFSGSLLHPGEINVIQLEIPNAARPPLREVWRNEPYLLGHQLGILNISLRITSVD